MHLCSLNMDVHQDDLTPLLNDHLWSTEGNPFNYSCDLDINKTARVKVTFILSAAEYRASLTWQNVGISVFLSVVLSARFLEGPKVVVTRK